MDTRARTRFLFDRRSRAARDGETVLGALVRRDGLLLQRSVRYHRPRGPFCGIGHCTGCLVRVNGRPNVRACRYPPAAGDRVESENAWPSPKLDLLAALDYLFPNGIDTLHGFVRPAWATGLYHRVVRRLAGYGEPPTAHSAAALARDPVRRSADVVVVGAGRAGHRLAEKLVEGGVAPLLVDRSLHPDRVPGTEILPATTITFLPPPAPSGERPFLLTGFTEPGGGVQVRARRVVVATGSYDAGLLFEGNDRPGVMTADAAFALAPSGPPPPFHHAVLFGAGPRALQVVERLGEHVAALVAPGEISPDLTRAASAAGIPLYPRSLLLSTEGARRVRSVELRARAKGTPTRLDCDAVLLAHRRLPHGQLFFQAGVRMGWRAQPGGYYPLLDDDGATSVAGLWAVGSAAACTADATIPSADRVAGVLEGRATEGPGPERLREDGPNELEGYYRELLQLPRHGRWVACACEDILLEEVEAASQRGYRGIEVVKRYTGVGTGLCQGRYCLPDALLVLARAEERRPSEVGYITQRPPVVPTPIAALAPLDERTAEPEES
jgi:sarcosine oxidase, subunit alpha